MNAPYYQDRIEPPLHLERSCSLIASTLSAQRREGVRLMTGEQRRFGLSTGRRFIHIPFPPAIENWNLRTLSCGIALQCSPSKDRLADYPLAELGARETAALTITEAEVALAWIAEHWPGLGREIHRIIPSLIASDHTLSAESMIERAMVRARGKEILAPHILLGELPQGASGSGALMSALKRVYGRMPWSANRTLSKAPHTIPVGGDGGAQNRNLPPPSKPEDDDPEIRRDQRAGIPYPEWNAWQHDFLKDHVAVLERKHPSSSGNKGPQSQNLRRWFEEHTYRVMRNRLEDGSDLDIGSYIDHYIDTRLGASSDARVFRNLLPAARDVSTAVLLDGSASLGASGGSVFRLELACADALCQAMTQARERHGLFVFSGNTRHRVDVVCLKDFNEPHLVVPSELGLAVGGYTRLGAPIRHLTSRLLDQSSERRLLIIIGDGLMSDDGYEGKYAWADAAHAVEEAEQAGITLYYIGVGPTRVDPLPEVFGSRRSQRIRRVEELPRILAQVHRELVAT